jgi:hypothetical protein
MNDLKESNETIKQTTDELKNTIDMLNKDKNDWVFSYVFVYSRPHFLFFFFKAKKSDIERLEEKLRNLEKSLVRSSFSYCFKYIYF